MKANQNIIDILGIILEEVINGVKVYLKGKKLFNGVKVKIYLELNFFLLILFPQIVSKKKALEREKMM